MPSPTLQDADRALQGALAARREGDLDGAARLLLDALAIYDSLERPDRSVLARVNLGAIEMIRGRLDDAHTQFQTALDHARDLDDGARIALCLGNIAAIQLERGAPDEAEPLLIEALERYRAIGNHAGAGNQLGNLGMLYQSRGELDRARATLQEAAEAFVTAEHPAGAAGVLRVLGGLARKEGKTDQAREAFERALVISRDIGDFAGEAYALRSLGQIHMAAGQLTRATTFFNQSLELHIRAGDAKGSSSAHLDLGQAIIVRGDIEDGLEHLRRAVQLALDAKLTEAHAAAALALGTQLGLHGHTDEGARALETAERLYIDMGDPFGLGATRINQITVALRTGRWSQLQERIDAEITRAREHDLAALLPTLHALNGQLSQSLGHLPLAIEAFEAAAQGFSELGQQRRALSARLTRALLLMERDEADGLEDEILQIQQQFHDFKEPSSEADALQTVGELYRTQRRFDDAEAAFERAATLFAPLENPASTASLHISRAENALRREPWTAPDSPHVTYALTHLDAALILARDHELEPKRALALALRADAARRQGRVGDAEADLGLAIQTAHGLDYPMALARTAQVQARIAKQLGQDALFHAARTEAHDHYQRMGARVHLRELEEDFPS